MDSQNIKIQVHYPLLYKKQVLVNVLSLITVLDKQYSQNLDYYYHAQKLDKNKSFFQQNLNFDGLIIHAYYSQKQYCFDPLFFKFLDGQTITMVCPMIWTFKIVIDKISEMKGISPDKIRLVFAGRKLNPNCAFLDESGMQKQTTIHVIVSP